MLFLEERNIYTNCLLVKIIKILIEVQIIEVVRTSKK